MINCNDCVILSDEDPSDQVHEISQIKRKRKGWSDKHRRRRSTETVIVLDEDQTDNNNIIEIPDSKDSRKHDIILAKLEKIHRDDELFSDFIEKCLDLENSDGMIRIVNKTLIKAYEESDIEYRKSADFNRVVLKALKQLDTDPDHKFSHVRDFVETLKFHKFKKRVQLTTLATNLRENGITQKKSFPKNSKIGSIILDSDDEQKESPTVNLDDSQTEIIVLDERQAEEEKENHGEVIENGNISNSQENFLVPQVEVSWNSCLETNNIVQQVIPIEYEAPTTASTVSTEPHKQKIQMIEYQIACYKEKIAILEEAEVVDDSVKSPKNSKIGSIILDSDDEQKESPTVNLDDSQTEIIVLDERQAEEEKENQGEVIENGNISNSQENFLVPQVEVSWNSCLETNNIVQQVIPIEYEAPTTASTVSTEPHKQKIQMIEYQIACYKEKIAILEEAEVVDDSVKSPYVICEKYKAQVVELYKDLCKLVGEEPVKRRKVRLQVLEGHPPGPVRRLETFINDNIGEDGNPLFPDFCDAIKCVMVANIEDKLGWSKAQVMNEANALFTHCGRALQKQRQRREYRELLARVKLEADAEDPADPADQDPELLRRLEWNRKVAVKNLNDLLDRYANLQHLPPQKEKPGPSSEKPDEPESVAIEDKQPNLIPCSELISDEDSNFEPPEVKLSQESNIKTELGVHSENKDGDNGTKVKVKQEPMDIVQMLEELGDNYTMLVIDIEDPFLVIEISSEDDESSDEEIVVEGESD